MRFLFTATLLLWVTGARGAAAQVCHALPKK